MIKRLFILFMIIITAGCANNYVSNNRWSDPVTYIDSAGKSYFGEVVFHGHLHTGTLSFANTPSGHLTGKFTTITPTTTSSKSGVAAVNTASQLLVVPSISNQTIKLGNSNGTAFLIAGDTVFVKCQIGVDFVPGYGEIHIVGGGVCQDDNGEKSHLMFGL